MQTVTAIPEIFALMSKEKVSELLLRPMHGSLKRRQTVMRTPNGNSG